MTTNTPIKTLFANDIHRRIEEVIKVDQTDEEIIREGDMDDRFYVVVAGDCNVLRHGRTVGHLGTGDCFGEASYVPGARRSAFDEDCREAVVFGGSGGSGGGGVCSE